MAAVIVSHEARKDLEGIRAYIPEEPSNPQAATKIMGLLRGCVTSLAEMPQRGTPLDMVLSVHTEYRFLVCGQYMIYYLYDGDTVEVARVLHQRQDFIRALFVR